MATTTIGPLKRRTFALFSPTRALVYALSVGSELPTRGLLGHIRLFGLYIRAFLLVSHLSSASIDATCVPNGGFITSATFSSTCRWKRDAKTKTKVAVTSATRSPAVIIGLPLTRHVSIT